MGFFRRSKKTFTPPETDPAPPLPMPMERRMHGRYQLVEEDSILLTFDGGLRGKVLDLSYGGALVRLIPTGATRSLPNRPGVARLSSFGKHAPVDYVPVRILRQSGREDMASVQFQHSSPESLLFLREVIEPLRQGTTLKPIRQELVKERFRAGSFTCFRGEGPTDLVLEANEGGPGLKEAQLTFRHGEDYWEVRLLGNGTLVTSHSAEPERDHANPLGLGSRMEKTDRLDAEILRYGAYILLGACLDHGAVIRPLLDRILTALGSLTEESAA